MTTCSWECYLSPSNHVAQSCLSLPLTGNLSVFYVCQLPLISHHGSWVCHHQVLFSFVFYNRRNIACWLDLMLSSLCTNTDYSLTSKITRHISDSFANCQWEWEMFIFMFAMFNAWNTAWNKEVLKCKPFLFEMWM